jgi:ERF superfamily
MQKSESIIELAKAMAKFQEELEQPEKSADNPFFKSKYVPLPNVISVIKKHAHKHGLSYMQMPITNEKGIGVETIVMHSSGEYIQFDPFFLPMDKQTAQGAGSSTTYAKRYALSAAFGIDSDIDDDGNGASGNSNPSNNSNKQQNNNKNTNTNQQQNNSNSGGFKASEAQVKLLHKLTKEYAEKSSYTEEQIKKSLTNHVGDFGMSYKEMSGGKGNQASKAIEKLNSLLKGE